MCFVPTKNSVVQVATKNIKCYKRVRPNRNGSMLHGKVVFESRHRFFSYTLGDHYKIDRKKDILARRGAGSMIKDYMYGGVFHSFKRYPDDYKWCINIECIIPKGALFTYNNSEYISNEIKINKIIYKEKHSYSFYDSDIRDFLKYIRKQKLIQFTTTNVITQ